MDGNCFLNDLPTMAALEDDEENGTTAKELEEAVGTKVAFAWSGYRNLH